MTLTDGSIEYPRRFKSIWICQSNILDRGRLCGSERIERLQHLAQEGHDVCLVTAFFDKKRFDSICLNPHLRLVSIPLKYKTAISSFLYGLVLLFFLPIYLVEFRPDFLISDPTTAPFLAWNPVLSKLLGFKTILDIRSTPVGLGTKPTTLRWRFLFSSSIWIAKTMFNGMTIVTPMMRDEICRSFGINPSWTGILSNGISAEVFVPEKENRKFLRERFGLAHKFVVIYHGSLRVAGGLIESTKSIALLRESYPDIVLFLLGRSEKEDMALLRQTIKENNLEKNVILHEPVDFHEVPKYIAMSDLGLVPLPNIPFWRYQQPLKLLEYMAMNKPFVVSESPAHRSVVNQGKNAIYIPKVTPFEVASAIKYAYENRTKLDDWGSVGRDIIMKKYVWKKVNEAFTIYLQNVRLGTNGYPALRS